MNKKTISIFLGTLIVAILGTIVIKNPDLFSANIMQDQSNPTSFYVSPGGNDTNLGTFDQPWKTLEKARNAVRLVNTNMTKDITVYLRGGTYELSKKLLLRTQDSGTNGFNIIYTNYGTEVPIISGGKKITGWIQEGDKWKANVGTNIDTRQLYVNGRRAIRARSNEGLPGAVKTVTGYTTTDTNMQKWENISDVEFVSSIAFKQLRCGVASISGNAITMKQPCWNDSQAHTGLTMGLPNWIENAYELLDSPGEWYLSRFTGWLYYKPLLGENMSSADVVLPVLETLIVGQYGQNVTNIQFKGLTFSYATWLKPNTNDGFPELQANHVWGTGANVPGNVIFYNSKNISFIRNVFSHLGGAGLEFRGGSSNNNIIGNNFTDISSTAISLGDLTFNQPDINLIEKDNQIKNNYIHNVAAEYQGGVGIFIGNTQSTIVEHNELIDLPYAGISIGWGWSVDLHTAKDNKIRYNKISNHMKFLHDGGGIYSVSAQSGNEYSHNFITNQKNEYGAIYLDAGSKYIEVANNVIFNNKFSASINGENNNIHDNWWQEQKGVVDYAGRTLNGVTIVECGSDMDWSDCETTKVENNHHITNLNQAPISIINNAGLEAQYKDIVSIYFPTPHPTPTPPPVVVPLLATGTINTITTPRNTSLGTISGTAFSNDGLSLVQLTIRKNSTDDANLCTKAMDWDGSKWVPACQFYLTATGTTNWSYSSTPQAKDMIHGERYKIFLSVVDSKGRRNDFVASKMIKFQTPFSHFQSYNSPNCNNITDDGCVGTDNPNDKAVCTKNTDCVYQGTCYASGTLKDLNADNKIDGWCAGKFPQKWRDCDSYQPTCIAANGCNSQWIKSGETIQFGEYENFDHPECCGDDKNEYAITTDGKTACCDKADDTVDSNGKCITGISFNAYFQSYNSPNCNNITDDGCVGTDNPNDKAVCTKNTDCVYQGTCYASGTLKDLNADNKIDGWCAGKFPQKWRDCDSYQPTCIAANGCNSQWIKSGETIQFGEYENFDHPECCGDDKNEYAITTDGKTACCDKADDILDANGKCM